MCFKYKATEFSGQERKHLKVCGYKPSESFKSSTASICLAIPSSHMLGGPLLLVTGFTILKNCYVSEIALINWSKLFPLKTACTIHTLVKTQICTAQISSF